MRVLALTFNCFKQEFHEGNSFDWLTEEIDRQCAKPILPDLIAIGLQEFLPFNKAFIGGDDFYEELIREKLHMALESAFSLPIEPTKSPLAQNRLHIADRQFAFVKKACHVGNIVFLFSKTSLRISNVCTSYMGSGWFWMGNKGAVAIKLSIEDKNAEGKTNIWSMCILSCHFDAHKTDPYARNNQFQEISTRIIFEEPSDCDLPLSFVEDQDVTILLGDLNYRVYNEFKSAEELISLHQSERYDELFKYDQLTNQFSKNSHPFINQFTEAKVIFLPTYKYSLGSDKIDETRIPSWCDRVLYRSTLYDCQVIKYLSIPSCQLSDHKPVMAILDISTNSTTATRAFSEREIAAKTQTDSYHLFKKRVGATADLTAGLAFNVLNNPLKIPIIALGIFVIFLASTIRN